MPELDKLVRLSRLFGVTLDALVLETAPAPEDAPESAPSAPPPKPDPGFCRGQAAGTILLCMSLLVALALAQEGLGTGLLLASPFLLCGAVCLLFRRRAGLWCGWIVFLLADLYFRLAAGVNWRLTLHTRSFTPEQNDWRLATAWVQLLLDVGHGRLDGLQLPQRQDRALPAGPCLAPGRMAAAFGALRSADIPRSIRPFSVVPAFPGAGRRSAACAVHRPAGPHRPKPAANKRLTPPGQPLFCLTFPGKLVC